MNKSIIISTLVLFSFMFGASQVFAVKPGAEGGVNPNGFPSGTHYNLNIHGKKADFKPSSQEYYYKIVQGSGEYNIGDLVESCPDGYTCDLTNTPIYGNSIFVPENGEDIEIYMQSGSSGGKGKKAEALPQNELWAVDPYAVFDGDGAIIQLPPGEYDVYARALAKPTDNPDLTVSPALFAAEDENGNELVYLGMVYDGGFATTEYTVTRSKGKSTAVPITGLFEWSGQVCYFSDPGDAAIIDTKCCVDIDNDGVYDECSEPELDAELNEFCPEREDGIYVDKVTVYCKTYESEWVFNIADFVTYLWNADNNGLKLLQIRFYPRK